MVNQKEGPGLKMIDLTFLRSVLREDHISHAILRVCERLELAIHDTKRSFNSKVEVLMSVLESLMADSLTRDSREIISIFFEYLVGHTLLLVFHGDWGLNKMAKYHLSSLFNQFKVRAGKKKLTDVVGKTEYLLDLMRTDPWGSAALMETLTGGKENDFEFLEFVKQEMGIFLIVRLQVMVYARCEVQAMAFVEKCLQCISTNAHLFLPYFLDEITYLRDLHLILLNNAKSNSFVRDKLLYKVNIMGLDESLKCVQRCKQGLQRFEMYSKKTADVVLNMALAFSVIKEDTDEHIFQELVKVWFDSIADIRVLKRMLRLIVQNAVSSRYVYTFGQILMERFKLSEKALCVEVYIKGLSLDMNLIERYKLNNDEDNVRKYEVQLSNGFLKLGDYFKDDFFLCRECVLTAFSLDPSLSSFERIKRLSEKSRKLIFEITKKNVGVENDSSLINVGECMSPRCKKNLVVVLERCDSDPPLLAKQVFDVSDHNELGASDESDETSPPILSPQRPLSYNTGQLDGTNHFNLLLKNGSEQIQISEQILGENRTKCNALKEISRCTLTKDISDLSLDIHNRHYESTPGDAKSGLSQSIQAYDAESVGIPQPLCDDLSTLVSHGRNQDLSWDLKWDELSRRCEAHLLRTEETFKCRPNMFREKLSEIQDENKEQNSHCRFVNPVNPIRSSKRKRKPKKTADYDE